MLLRLATAKAVARLAGAKAPAFLYLTPHLPRQAGRWEHSHPDKRPPVSGPRGKNFCYFGYFTRNTQNGKSFIVSVTFEIGEIIPFPV